MNATNGDRRRSLPFWGIGISPANPSGIGGPTRLRPTPFAIGLGLTLVLPRYYDTG